MKTEDCKGGMVLRPIGANALHERVRLTTFSHNMWSAQWAVDGRPGDVYDTDVEYMEPCPPEDKYIPRGWHPWHVDALKEAGLVLGRDENGKDRMVRVVTDKPMYAGTMLLKSRTCRHGIAYGMVCESCLGDPTINANVTHGLALTDKPKWRAGMWVETKTCAYNQNLWRLVDGDRTHMDAVHVNWPDGVVPMPTPLSELTEVSPPMGYDCADCGRARGHTKAFREGNVAGPACKWFAVDPEHKGGLRLPAVGVATVPCPSCLARNVTEWCDNESHATLHCRKCCQDAALTFNGTQSAIDKLAAHVAEIRPKAWFVTGGTVQKDDPRNDPRNDMTTITLQPGETLVTDWFAPQLPMAPFAITTTATSPVIATMPSVPIMDRLRELQAQVAEAITHAEAAERFEAQGEWQAAGKAWELVCAHGNMVAYGLPPALRSDAQWRIEKASRTGPARESAVMAGRLNEAHRHRSVIGNSKPLGEPLDFVDLLPDAK